MIIKKLYLKHLRAYTEADFEFQPGMNLLVGINGVGKSTALEALRICLSQIQPEISSSKSRKENFGLNDIQIGKNDLKVICDFELVKQPVKLEIDFQYKLTTSKPKVSFLPKLEKISSNSISENIQPIGIFFSTRRSLIVDRDPSKTMSVGGQAAAFGEALLGNREFNLRIYTDWIRVQLTFGKENPVSLKSVEVLSNAVYRFLPGFSNLQVKEINGEYALTIDKGETTLNINQLSDGEKGVLSLVIDIARRLFQANPDLEDPLSGGKAVILIDELDLHLHPKWQRSIVNNLTRVFPNCQFIATTHSPQIISALEPERIHIINANEIIPPDRTLGIDTNWILKHLMEADDRPEEATRAIEEVEQLIEEVEFDQAKAKIAHYKRDGLDLPEWSVFEARIARLEIIDNEE